MSLAPGTRVGAYEILSALGTGGMGAVYRARDTKLNRDVAIKVLLPAIAHDPDRLARFSREAQVLASLNHPNIAQIYGFEDTPDTPTLVMELVEGPTLADRLASGAVNLDDALPIARQIAEALEAAHDRGVIHRDLKPANIALTDDGRVKVLDFGLAKALADDATSGVNSAGLSHSPTLTLAATQVGVILGTAAYMSPEQAKGRSTDKRSDVWAFGCVLFEMLTGKRAFEGEDVSDTLAAVLRGEPDWAALPNDLSPALALLVRRCLERDRRRRIGDVSTVLFLIDQPAISPTLPPAAPVVVRPGWTWIVSAFGVAIVAMTAAAGVAWRLKPAPRAIVARFPLNLTDGFLLSNVNASLVTISRDGTKIAYAGVRRLYGRSMSDPEIRPISGIDLSVRNPVFSPDGESLAFTAVDDLTIKRVAVTGGVPTTICSIGSLPTGLVWDRDWVFWSQSSAPSAAPSGIFRVAATGGTPELVIKTPADQIPQGPQILPDGDHVLFALARVGDTTVDRWTKSQIVVQSIATGDRTTLFSGGSDPRYLPTGHIAYAMGGVVYAVRFDLSRLQVTGGAVPIIEGVRAGGGLGAAAHYAVSQNGSAVYVPGPVSSAAGQQTLALIARTGATEPLKLRPGAYSHPRISRDGKQVAVATEDGREAHVWVYDLSGNTSQRRLTVTGKNRYPVWSPDGQYVAYQSDRNGTPAIYRQRADGTGVAEQLTTPQGGAADVPETWSPDGRHLIYSHLKDETYSATVLSLEDRKTTAFSEIRSSMPITAAFSPDGKWVAYVLRGQLFSQVYVQPFPPTGATYPLTKYGTSPHHPFWSRDGKALYFIPGPGELAFVNVTTQPAFAVSEPIPLPRGPLGFIEGGPTGTRQNDSTADGRIIAVVPAGQAAAGSGPSQQLFVVLNWFEVVKARLPD